MAEPRLCDADERAESSTPAPPPPPPPLSERRATEAFAALPSCMTSGVGVADAGPSGGGEPMCSGASASERTEEAEEEAEPMRGEAQGEGETDAV